MNQKILFKKFVYIFTFLLALFVLYHFIVWNLWTSQILGRKDNMYVGDLARMSYQINSIHLREEINDLPLKHISYDNYTKEVKPYMVTIGDSFSNGGALGKNPYYQDYFASYLKKSILNIQSPDENLTYIEVVNALIDKGWFDVVKPKYVLIETVGRRVSKLYAKEQQWNIDLANDYEKKLYGRPWRDTPQVPMIINTANYKLPYYNMAYRFNSNAQKNVIKLKSTKPLFSIDDNKSLLIYKEDIENMIQYNIEYVRVVNDNLNKLADKLNGIGVKLIFMPAVDKYDLYSIYIEDNPYINNESFDNLRTCDKKYILLDTKSILQKAVIEGELDMFYSDDTHWSYKASEFIAQHCMELCNE